MSWYQTWCPDNTWIENLQGWSHVLKFSPLLIFGPRLSVVVVHKHVKMSVGKLVMEPKHPYKHVHISENQHFCLALLSSRIISQLYFIRNYWTFQTLHLILADTDTQSILSVVDKYPKNVLIKDKYCGQVDLYVDNIRIQWSTLQLPQNP